MRYGTQLNGLRRSLILVSDRIQKRYGRMQPAKLYACVGLLLALPLVAACLALSRWQLASTIEHSTGSEGQRTGLRLLLLQTLVPPLQVLPLLRSVTTSPSQLDNASVILLPIASFLLGSTSFYFVIRYSRRLARVALPLLNLLVFTYSAALFVAAGATA